jgi:hypothetical protein
MNARMFSEECFQMLTLIEDELSHIKESLSMICVLGEVRA